MKYHVLLRIFLTLLVSWIGSTAFGQSNVNMPYNSGPQNFAIAPPATCFFNFYDNGGPALNYSNSANAATSIVTFAPSAPGKKVQAQFQTFSVEPSFDALYIYDGANSGAPLISSGNPAGFTFQAGGWWGTALPSNTATSGLVRATGGNASGALTFQFTSDATASEAGWVAVVSEITPLSCAMTAPANILNAVTASGACSANVTTAIPGFNPGGCNAGLNLRYRINGGAAVDLGLTPPSSVTLNDVPKGSNVVIWELAEPCGGAVVASVMQLITVLDQTPPIITCPANAVVNLSPGVCQAPFVYTVSCFDNCPISANAQVNTPFDFNNGNAGIMFDVENLSSATITLTQFGPSLDPGTWPMEVYVTTTANTWQGNESNPAAWTLLGAQTVTSGSASVGTPVPAFGLTLLPGQRRGIYLTSTTGFPVNYTDGSRQLNDGMLAISSAPGAGKSYPFGATSISRAYNGFVSYTANSGGAPEQIAGIPSGGQYPIGVTTNIFRCTDLAGNSSTCSFTVTVLEFPNPKTSLSCNDIVTIALGPNCMDTINADQVLEGGPYKCYDNYIVELDKIPPFGNGPWQPAYLNGNDIGKTYAVRVTDPATDNQCSGSIQVQDNLPPKLECAAQGTTIPCNFPTSPTYSGPATVTQKVAASSTPFNVLDFQTVERNFTVSGPAGAIVSDVDLRTWISGDVFNFNFRIQIESPSGTVVTVWDQFGGCAGPMRVRFDDSGDFSNSCAAYTSDQKATPPLLIGQLSAFNGQAANGVWKVRFSDVDGFGDISSVQLAELFVQYNATFSAGFPNGLQFPAQVTQTGATTFVVPAPLLDGCSNVTLSYVDQISQQNCSSPFTSVINRTWTARDASNNVSTCVQVINLLRPTIDDILLPPSYDDVSAPAFDCNGDYPSPEWIQNQGGQGFPYAFGLPNGCNISWIFNDFPIKVCDGTVTIRREWIVVDGCTSQNFTYNQIVRVSDATGPQMTCPANLTVTTDIYGCCGTTKLPNVILTDDCSRINNVNARIEIKDFFTGNVVQSFLLAGSLATFPGNNLNNPDTMAVMPNTPCLPTGTHTVTYTAQDDCGNTSTCSFTLTVLDLTPPAAACDKFTVVAIGPDDPNDCYDPSANGCEFGGVTWVKAVTFDDGSYDNCGNLRFTIRRKAPYSDCITSLNPINGAPPCDDPFPDAVSEFQLATAESDSIKFYCCEVGTTQRVIMRVYQLDFNGNLSLGLDGEPIYNECEIEVTVQDKLRPGCTSPPNVTVSCENFDPSLWAYGLPEVKDNCCLDTTVQFMGQKGLTHSVNYAQFDTTCNRGTIVRTFRVFDCHGQSSQCTQRIIVNYSQQGYYIKFPDDKMVTSCGGTAPFGEPTFFGEDCELLAVSHVDEVFTVVPDACFKIERTWTVINWCNYSPNSPCTLVPNPNPNALINHPSNLPGPIVSPMGTPAPWAPTVVKVNPTDPQPTNYATFWNINTNCYRYKQIVKVVDNEAPVIENCPASPVEFCDVTENNAQLWNEIYWFDPACQTNNLCEGEADLNIVATDACSGANISVRYLLFLDLDYDGVMETVVNSAAPPAPGTVNFGNANSPNYSGGSPRQFDHRAVANSQKYQFALQLGTVGNKVTAAVRWNTQSAPNSYKVAELPYGTHKIKWIVTDGCGNEKVCEYTFVVKDCKRPSVVCLNGLSINMMPNNMLMMTPANFLQSVSDNCTPSNMIKLGVRRSGTGTGFPFAANGVDGNQIIQFTCDDIGTQLVEIWGMDKAGNADYCETYVIVQDNAGICINGDKVSVAGKLQTEQNSAVEEAGVDLHCTHPSTPPVTMFYKTTQTGAFMFGNAVPMAGNFTLTPIKDDYALNGVTTYDLVLINKHILGQQLLDSPYKLIAADANKSGTITTFDIVELRKLILGIYQELPSNTSWRFVDKSHVFSNPANPWDKDHPSFAENISVAGATYNMLDNQFVGIKIGDVNGSAVANSLMQADDRSVGVFNLEIENRFVKTGEIFEATLRAANPAVGYQFTLLTDGLEALDLIPGEGQSVDNFGIFDGAITASVHGDQAEGFALRLRAVKSGRLSDMLRLSSVITRAEAYGPDLELLDVALRFHSEQGESVGGVGFELYQNQPNPWANRTLISFHLPEAQEATLSIFDESGRLLWEQQKQWAKGYNAVFVDRSALPQGGLMYYRLQSDKHSATMKMIQTR